MMEKLQFPVVHKTGAGHHYIASFPFYIKTNQLLFNLIFFSRHIKGIKLFKKVAWDAFGGQSAMKHETKQFHAGELSLDFNHGTVKEDTQKDVLGIYDMAEYVYNKFKDRREVLWEDIFDDLDIHPIFPSDGYKKLLKKMLKEKFRTINKRTTVIFNK